MDKTIQMRDVPEKIYNEKDDLATHGHTDALETPLFADVENPVFDGPQPRDETKWKHGEFWPYTKEELNLNKECDE